MQQLTTTATFTDRRPDDEVLTTIVARSVLEAALAEDEKAELWFDIGREDDETARLAIDLSASDLEEILRLSSGDDVALTLDGDGVAGLFDDPDVEAHGLKVAIAIAVTSQRFSLPPATPQRSSRSAPPPPCSAPASPRRLLSSAQRQPRRDRGSRQRRRWPTLRRSSPRAIQPSRAFSSSRGAASGAE